MRFEWIESQKAIYPIALLCKALQVSRSGIYARRKRPECARAKENRQLTERIRCSHEKSRQTYGSPRIHRDLVGEGKKVSVNRVAKLMRLAGLRAKRRRRFCKTTDSDHDECVAPNLLDRQFNVDEPNRVWVADITYIATTQGWLYLAIVLDLFSRRVVGWSMSDRIDTELTAGALRMAIERRQPSPGLLHHSDRGIQYCAGAYQQLLQSHGMVCSMSRKGDCWDNAVAESFFSTVELELLDHHPNETRPQMRRTVFDYIETFYNPRRRHSHLGHLSPADYELATQVKALAA